MKTNSKHCNSGSCSPVRLNYETDFIKRGRKHKTPGDVFSLCMCFSPSRSLSLCVSHSVSLSPFFFLEKHFQKCKCIIIMIFDKSTERIDRVVA